MKKLKNLYETNTKTLAQKALVVCTEGPVAILSGLGHGVSRDQNEAGGGGANE